jgi:hypothetical protein
MAPPNTVAISSGIPTDYFGQAWGSAAHIPSAWTHLGHVQPFIPVYHPDVTSLPVTINKTAPLTKPTWHTPWSWWRNEALTGRWGHLWQ